VFSYVFFWQRLKRGKDLGWLQSIAVSTSTNASTMVLSLSITYVAGIGKTHPSSPFFSGKAWPEPA
jgi:hypothetical protein